MPAAPCGMAAVELALRGHDLCMAALCPPSTIPATGFSRRPSPPHHPLSTTSPLSASVAVVRPGPSTGPGGTLDIERTFGIILAKEARVTARRRTQGQDLDFMLPRFARGVPAVGARDHAGGRVGLDIGRPSPPPDARSRGLSRARRGPEPGDPHDSQRGHPTRSLERAGAQAYDRRLPGRADHRRDRAGGPIEAYQDASETLAVPDMLAPSGDMAMCSGSAAFDDRSTHRRWRLRADPAAVDRAQR